MRILSIHNKYQIRGGEDESRESEERLLRDNGHQVDVYEENNDRIREMSTINAATRTIWSRESFQEVTRRLKQKRYDIVHIQNFFPLISPSVHHAAKEQGVAVVQTLRNYRLLCPNALFFRDGQVCEDCLGKPVPYPGIVHNCYRESKAASSVTAAMITAHRALGTWTKAVDCFITLTEFARSKFIEGGFPPDKILVKPNFVNPDPGVAQGEGGYALYVGRLSVEKGLDTLLEAWRTLETPYPLKIIGDGPLSTQVEEVAKQVSNIEWLGRKPLAEVHQLMGNASFLVFPSKWYETFGRVAVEAFSRGTPVVAAKIGAIAELIQHGRTGLLFSPGDATDLVAQVQWCLSNSTELAQMRDRAREEFELKFTAEANYKRIMEIYTQVLSNA